MANSLVRIGCAALLLAWTAGSRAERVLDVPAAGVLRVAEQGGQATVRLAELSVPPVGSAAPERARQALAGLVLGQEVRVQPLGRDAGGEVLAHVYVDGSDLGAALVERGYARVDPGAAPALQRLQREARRQRRGLWAYSASNTSRIFR